MLTLEHQYGEKMVVYSTLNQNISLERIKKARALFFVSMKNKLFSKNLIRWFLLYTKYMGMSQDICVVDRPYFSFEDWRLRNVKVVDQSSVSTLQKVSIEVKRKVEKLVNEETSSNIRIMEWDFLQSLCPDWVDIEIRNALEKKGKVHQLFFKQTKKIIRENIGKDDLEGKMEFLISEMPVLLWTYYGEPGDIVDFYPDRNTKFFWELEKGSLVDELPRISQMVKQATPHIYGHIMDVANNNI